MHELIWTRTNSLTNDKQVKREEFFSIYNAERRRFDIILDTHGDVFNIDTKVVINKMKG